jgi:hypothetical protein
MTHTSCACCGRSYCDRCTASICPGCGEAIAGPASASKQAHPEPGVRDSRYIEQVTLATAQVTEFLKFIPGTDRFAKPPSSAYWTTRGRTAARDAIVLEREVKEAYRYGVSENLMALGGGNYRGTPIRGTFRKPY